MKAEIIALVFQPILTMSIALAYAFYRGNTTRRLGEALLTIVGIASLVGYALLMILIPKEHDTWIVCFLSWTLLLFARNLHAHR